MQTPTFSVVLIARNEEKKLPHLLASLKDFQGRGGTIVVVDTGSTDKTAQVARDAGCTVDEVGDRFVHVITEAEAQEINKHFIAEGEAPAVEAGKRIFDFAAARNYAATLSPTDWVATPDCDEVYTRLDLDAVEPLLHGKANQLCYHFVFAHDPQGRPTIEFDHAKFYNRTALHWEGVIHEVLVGDAQPRRTDAIRLEHYQNEETNRSGYLTGLAWDCWLHQEKDRNSHYLGREFYYTGRYRSAIKELTRHLGMNGWAAERGESSYYIARCYLALKERDKAVRWLATAYDIEPGRREPLMALAELYYREGRHSAAAAFAQAALQVPGIGFYGDYRPYYTYMPHEILYWALWYLGRKKEAAEHWTKCLELYPENPKYAQDAQFFITP